MGLLESLLMLWGVVCVAFWLYMIPFLLLVVPLAWVVERWQRWQKRRVPPDRFDTDWSVHGCGCRYCQHMRRALPSA